MSCAVEGCEKPVDKRGWCGMHYRRWQRHGDLLRGHPSAYERFARRVTVDESGCWLWTGSVGAGERAGYGQFWAENTNVRAHRWSYEHHVGPIPDGLELDHLCRNRRCVNPEHLEPVTTVENLRRGEGVPARNARKTHCIRGHPFDDANTIRFGPDDKWRRCRPCRDLQYRERRTRSALTK